MFKGSFSFSVWPFSMKLLWAPIVDSFYSHRIGRRKSWFIPAEYIIGLHLYYICVIQILVNTSKLFFIISN